MTFSQDMMAPTPCSVKRAQINSTAAITAISCLVGLVTTCSLARPAMIISTEKKMTTNFKAGMGMTNLSAIAAMTSYSVMLAPIRSGRRGADQLTGGTGNDVLNGGTGGDSYVFDLGDGQDVIFEADSLGDLNTIQFVSVLPRPVRKSLLVGYR